MATRISKTHACDLCGWKGQEVRLIEDGYGDVSVVVCRDNTECQRMGEVARWMDDKAAEAAAQDAYEAGNAPWAI